MRRSLGRRIGVTFFCTYMLVVAAGMVALKLAFLDPLVGFPYTPALAAEAAAADLQAAAGGGIAFAADGRLRTLQRHNPAVWALAREGRRTAEFGAVPAEARARFAAFAGYVASSEFYLGSVAPALRAAVVVTEDDIEPHPTIMAGGIDAARVRWRDWLTYLLLSDVIWAAPFAALLAAPAIWVATRVAMRGLKPVLADAAAIDPLYVERRLDEQRAPRELAPLTRAVNAALERLADELVRKRRFIADASHELRTPIAIMGMRIAALPAGEARRDLERGQTRLADMVGQMLDVERLAMCAPVPGQVDLVAVARDAVADYAPIAIQAGYEIALTGDAGPITVQGEPHMIGRALVNLIGNAVAHGGGRGMIEIRADAGGTLVVADEGPGIPPVARERVFAPFHRERWDRDGCGLGLHLVREVMAALGGEAAILDGPGCRVVLRFRPAAAEVPQAGVR